MNKTSMMMNLEMSVITFFVRNHLLHRIMPRVNSVHEGTRAKGQNVLPIAFRLPQIAVICQRINNYVEKGKDYLREEKDDGLLL